MRDPRRVDNPFVRLAKRLFGFRRATDDRRRVNPETGVIQTRGPFGWTDTDLRVNPSSGKLQERGVFGWVQVDGDQGEGTTR
jgi:hypothetical protein